MIKLPADFASLKRFILASYEKQQRAALDEFGGDEDEVQLRVARLRDWADYCETEKRELQRNAVSTELFGKTEPPSLDPIHRHSKCELCRGAGLYWSDGCTPRQWNRAKRYTAGFVVCRCEAGRIKNQVIREHGRKTDKPSRYVAREEF